MKQKYGIQADRQLWICHKSMLELAGRQRWTCTLPGKLVQKLARTE